MHQEDIQYLIATSDNNDFITLGLSNILLRKLGLSPETKHVNIQGMACIAFQKALELAEDHLSRYPKNHVMIVTSGINSRWFRLVKDIQNIV